MIDSTQWPLLHEAYGRAILITHEIENRAVLQVALWYMIKNRGGDEAFAEKRAFLKKKPFGRILEIGIGEGAFSAEDHEALDSYRELRNLLVHEITDSITFRLATKEDAANVINELNEIADDFSSMSSELRKSNTLLFQVAGGSLEDLEVKTDSLLKRLSEANILSEAQ